MKFKFIYNVQNDHLDRSREINLATYTLDFSAAIFSLFRRNNFCSGAILQFSTIDKREKNMLENVA